MIRPLRQKHRAVVCALAVVIPVGFAAGLAARRPVPIMAAVSPSLVANPQNFGKIVWTKADVWPGQRIVTSLRKNAAGAGAVELTVRDLERPDVLVYWAAGNDMAVESLPENAHLLGSLSNHAPLAIPAEARRAAGRFVLYSLADHEVVAVSKSVMF
jgi:hypothetical protein